MFTPRPYQTAAIQANLKFFQAESKRNAFSILPTGSGKSVVIANIVKELESEVLILQPSVEILEQNFAKFTSQGLRASKYSASAGSKHVDKVTFAMIGSVIEKTHLFQNHKKIIIDECHNVGPDAGMYNDFIKRIKGCKVSGMTATPYRLTAGFDGARLDFLNRTSPRIFDDCIYYIQNDVLFNAGHLAPLKYFSFDTIDRTKLALTSNGADFTVASMKALFQQMDMAKVTAKYVQMVLSKRRNVLVFSSFIEEAFRVQKFIPGSVVLTGETEKEERKKILSAFKSGKIKCLINVGVLTTGFDYPELEAVIMAQTTMSLALYYQIIGRLMRPFTYPDGSKKEGWFIDLGGNVKMFGKIETMRIVETDKGLTIYQGARPLTNVPFSRN